MMKRLEKHVNNLIIQLLYQKLNEESVRLRKREIEGMDFFSGTSAVFPNVF